MHKLFKKFYDWLIKDACPTTELSVPFHRSLPSAAKKFTRWGGMVGGHKRTLSSGFDSSKIIISRPKNTWSGRSKREWKWPPWGWRACGRKPRDAPKPPNQQSPQQYTGTHFHFQNVVYNLKFFWNFWIYLAPLASFPHAPCSARLIPISILLCNMPHAPVFFLLSSYSENIPRPYNVPLVVRHVSLVHLGIICSHLPFLSLSLSVCLLPFLFFNFIQTCASFPVSFFFYASPFYCSSPSFPIFFL